MQLIENTEQTPLDALRELIKSFLAQHPRLTVQALATRANVPVTSLRRILQEGTKSEVAPHTTLNLCAYITREKNIELLLNQLPQVLADFLRKHFGSFVFKGANERSFDIDLNQVLKDRSCYIVYKLAANRNGVSHSEAVEVLGKIGGSAIATLLSHEAIVYENDRYYAKTKEFTLSLDTAATHLSELTRYYKPNEAAYGLNLMYSLSESLNEEAIQKIKDIQREAIKAVHSIMQTPESFGKIPYFTLNLCESFLEAPKAGTLQ